MFGLLTLDSRVMQSLPSRSCSISFTEGVPVAIRAINGMLGMNFGRCRMWSKDFLWWTLESDVQKLNIYIFETSQNWPEWRPAHHKVSFINCEQANLAHRCHGNKMPIWLAIRHKKLLWCSKKDPVLPDWRPGSTSKSFFHLDVLHWCHAPSNFWPDEP